MKKTITLDWDDSVQYKFFSKEIMVPFVCLILMALGPAFAMTLTGSITPYMMADLNAAKYNSLQMIIGQVFTACSALAWGGIFDKYDKRNILISLSLFSIVSTIMKAMCFNLPMLIASVLVGSVGTGGANAGLVAMTAYLLPPTFRGRFYSVRALFNLILTALQPAASWVILNMGWRTNLWMSAGAYALVLIVILLAAPAMPAPATTVKKKYDFVGITIFLIGTILIFSASYCGGNILPWSSPILYILIAAGIVVYVLGLQYERKHDDIALISVSLMKNKNFITATIVGVFYLGIFSTVSYMQLLCVQGYGLALTTYSAIRVIPTMAGNGIGILFPIALEKFGVKPTVGVMVFMNVLAGFVFFFMRAATPGYVFFAISVGSFLTLALGQLLVANSVERKDISRAAGTYTFFYSFMSALEALIYNIILNNVHAMSVRPLAEKAGIFNLLSADQLKTMSTYTILSSAKSLDMFKATFGNNNELYEKAVAVVRGCVVASTKPIFLLGSFICLISFVNIFRLRKDIKIVAAKKK